MVVKQLQEHFFVSYNLGKTFCCNQQCYSTCKFFAFARPIIFLYTHHDTIQQSTIKNSIIIDLFMTCWYTISAVYIGTQLVSHPDTHPKHTHSFFFSVSCSHTSSPTMTPQSKTPTLSSVWLTRGRPGWTVSQLLLNKPERIPGHNKSPVYVPVAFLLYSRNSFQKWSLLASHSPVCVRVYVCTLSSSRHGRTGRVRSHERTIHEDRGGLPARLLSHWQRKVSDSSHQVEARS